MPSNATAKIKSALKRRVALSIVGGVLCIVMLCAAILVRSNTSAAERILTVNDRTYTLSIADTLAEQRQGLSGRSSMGDNEGMLFVFDFATPTCFWMKDMHFSLDIVWLDADRKVVHIEQEVSPDTYPEAFCPKKAAKYVVELKAGQVQQAGIRQGQSLTF